MRSASLLAVFILARVAALWGHTPPITAWSLLAYVWQDVMVTLAFAAFDFTLQKIGATTRIARTIYWTLAIYTAINIPVERVLSTPLTMPMLRATRGPLADSILLYLTATNLLLVAFVLA